MLGYLRRITISNLASPVGLAVISYGIFLFAWMFPPGLYTHYVREPDLMFLDPLTFAYFTSCVVSFLVGFKLYGYFRPKLSRAALPPISVRSPLIYLLVPLLLSLFVCIVYLLILGASLNFIGLLVSQQGGSIKAAGQAGQLEGGIWGESIILLTLVIWWSLYRAIQLRLRGVERYTFYAILFVAIVVDAMTCVARVDRGNLMPLFAGIILIHLFSKTRGDNVSLLRLATVGVIAGSGIVALFILLQLARGALFIDVLVTSLMGYTIVSYNRIPALLTGIMHYAYEGRGVYLSRYLLTDPKLNSLFHLSARFGWPDGFSLWQTEFLSTSACGLNPAFIWSGAFGYLYSDLGWGSLLYLFVTGIIAAYIWRRFLEAGTVSLMLYPWIGYCILTWFGMNTIFSVNFKCCIEYGLMLAFYEKAFHKKHLKTVQTLVREGDEHSCEIVRVPGVASAN